MKTSFAVLLLAFAAASAPAADKPDFPVREEETLQRFYPLAAAGSLAIDNAWGSIHVTAADTRQIDVTIHKRIRASSDLALSQVKRDVTIEVTAGRNAVTLFVNGPFRSAASRECCSKDADDLGYIVAMDFDVVVPRQIALTLKTVNEGEIRVRDVSGVFSIQNVRGSIDMQDVAGSGEAKTVNGAIKIAFKENPKSDSRFASVHGAIDLYFPRGLSADFRFHNYKGAVYSDYALSPLPPRPPRTETRDGKFTYRADAFTGGRAGAGGPEITVDNLDGDIHVLAR